MQALTVIEGRVPSSKAKKLEVSYRELKNNGGIPKGIIKSYLSRDSGDSENYKLVTLWESKKVFEKYRDSVEIPKGIELFKKLGINARMTLFEVAASVP